MNGEAPLVSIIMPVYNGEAFLEESLDSVLAQSYPAWECIIVNNSSTDATGEIAERYCQRDSRFRLHTTERLLPVIENHNFAFGKIAEQSRYCKILHADDLLFPNCLQEMVHIGEKHPEAGIIGAYSLAGKRVRCDGLPRGKDFFPGREIGKLTLMDRIYPFWSPSSTLLRTRLLRERGTLYASERLHADVELMYELLQKTGFGFVHQVLTYIREHEASETSRQVKSVDAAQLSNLELYLRYGPHFLDEEEFDRFLRKRLDRYYRSLAIHLLEGWEREFWKHHIERLRQMDQPLSLLRLASATLRLTAGHSALAVRALRQRLTRGKK